MAEEIQYFSKNEDQYKNTHIEIVKACNSLAVKIITVKIRI